MTTSRPLIGIVLDWQERGSFSPRPHYAVRDGYFSCVWQAGGMPVGLPLMEETLAETLARVDGVLIPGGDYPSPSRWYDDGHGLVDEHPRTILNETLIRELVARDMPLLGICAGHQELIAALGGKLHWKVSKSVPGAGEHREVDLAETAHTVKVAEGTLLRKLVGAAEIKVNSHHNEAGKTLNGGLICSGVAPDGVIEAAELPGKKFVLGVQWHPEFLLTAADVAILEGFVNACKK